MTAIRDDLDNTAIIGVGAALTFVVAFLILILQAWSLKMENAVLATKSGKPATLQTYEVEMAEKLGGIDQAKEATLKALSR